MKRVYKCKEEPEGLKRYRTNYRKAGSIFVGEPDGATKK